MSPTKRISSAISSLREIFAGRKIQEFSTASYTRTRDFAENLQIVQFLMN
jgi:hypothetical protein